MTQNNNQSNNHIIIINDVSHTITEWCRIYNIKYDTVHDRIERGWDEIKALTTPVKSTVKA